MNTLYFSPGACSLGIQILLQEIGAPYQAERIKVMEGEQFSPAFVAINPKSKVPTLRRADGSVLTEFVAIAFWLGVHYPEAQLWPANSEAQTRVLEALDYISATIHGQGFMRLFRPVRFNPDEAGQEAVKAAGREIVEKGFAIISDTLGQKEFVAGDYSIADATLYYVCRWAVHRVNIPLPANLEAHFARMNARPAVQRALQKEGLEH